jgi:hypothetical protein
MSLSNIFFSFSITSQSPKIVFHFSHVNAKHFLGKAIYWTTVTAASFRCCCTSVNFDCKPPFCRKFVFPIPHCKKEIKTTHELNSAQHVLNCMTETGLCEHPLEVTVKISSEVETWSARTTNYNVHHDHRKTECRY